MLERREVWHSIGVDFTKSEEICSGQRGGVLLSAPCLNVLCLNRVLYFDCKAFLFLHLKDSGCIVNMFVVLVVSN